MSENSDKMQELYAKGINMLSNINAFGADGSIMALRQWCTDRAKHCVQSSVRMSELYDALANNDGVSRTLLSSIANDYVVLDDGVIMAHDVDFTNTSAILTLWYGENKETFPMTMSDGKYYLTGDDAKRWQEKVDSVTDLVDQVSSQAVEFLEYSCNLCSSVINDANAFSAVVANGLSSSNNSIREIANQVSTLPTFERAQGLIGFFSSYFMTIADSLRSDVVNAPDEDPGVISLVDYEGYKTGSFLAGAWDIITAGLTAAGSMCLMFGGPIAKTVGAIAMGAGWLVSKAIEWSAQQETFKLGSGKRLEYGNAMLIFGEFLSDHLVENKTIFNDCGTIMTTTDKYNPYRYTRYPYSGLFYPRAECLTWKDESACDEWRASVPYGVNGLVGSGNVYSYPRSVADRIYLGPGLKSWALASRDVKDNVGPNTFVGRIHSAVTSYAESGDTASADKQARLNISVSMMEWAWRMAWSLIVIDTSTEIRNYRLQYSSISDAVDSFTSFVNNECHDLHVFRTGQYDVNPLDSRLFSMMLLRLRDLGAMPYTDWSTAEDWAPSWREINDTLAKDFRIPFDNYWTMSDCTIAQDNPLQGLEIWVAQFVVWLTNELGISNPDFWTAQRMGHMKRATTRTISLKVVSGHFFPAPIYPWGNPPGDPSSVIDYSSDNVDDDSFIVDGSEFISDPFIIPPRFEKGSIAVALLLSAAAVAALVAVTTYSIVKWRNHCRAKATRRENEAIAAAETLRNTDPKDKDAYKAAMKDYLKKQRRFQRYASFHGYASNNVGSFSSRVPSESVVGKVLEYFDDNVTAVETPAADDMTSQIVYLLRG